MEKFLLEKVVTKQKILLQSSALPVLRRFHRKDVTDDVLVLEVVVYADIMSELCVKVAEDFPRLIALGIVFFVWFHHFPIRIPLAKERREFVRFLLVSQSDEFGSPVVHFGLALKWKNRLNPKVLEHSIPVRCHGEILCEFL